MSTRNYDRRSDSGAEERRFNAFQSPGGVQGDSGSERSSRGLRPGRYVQEAAGHEEEGELHHGLQEEVQEVENDDQLQEEWRENEGEEGDLGADPHGDEGHLPVLEEAEEEELEHDPTPGSPPSPFRGLVEPQEEPEGEQIRGEDQQRVELFVQRDPEGRRGDDHGGLVLQVGAPRNPDGQPDDWIEFEAPNYSVWITPQGTRYHSSTTCVTLANTRRIALSPWCPICGRSQSAPRYSPVFVRAPGDEAHHDRQCPRAGNQILRRYPFCQRCTTIPAAVVRQPPMYRRPRFGG